MVFGDILVTLYFIIGEVIKAPADSGKQTIFSPPPEGGGCSIFVYYIVNQENYSLW